MSVRSRIHNVVSFFAVFLFAIVLASGCDDDSGNSANNNNQTNNGTDTNNGTEDQPPEFLTTPAKVLEVLDGDTIRVKFNGHNVKIRFLGVNCPEISHNGNPAEPYADEAMNYTTQRARPGWWVGLEFDTSRQYCQDFVPDDTQYNDCTDIYGRILAYIRTTEDQDLGAQLLINGYAKVYTNASFDRKSHYLELQSLAQEEGRGIWSTSK